MYNISVNLIYENLTLHLFGKEKRERNCADHCLKKRVLCNEKICGEASQMGFIFLC
jgi:hypothetical protein